MYIDTLAAEVLVELYFKKETWVYDYSHPCPSHNLRAAIREVERLGRPLTDAELKRFEIPRP